MSECRAISDHRMSGRLYRVRDSTSMAAATKNHGMTVRPGQRELRARVEAAFDFLTVEHDCRKRGRFVPGGMEILYWNTTTGIRVSVQAREEFVAHLCPLSRGGFPPGSDRSGADRSRIEWFDAFDAVKLVTGRRPRLNSQQLYGNDPAIIAAYASAIQGPCWPLLSVDNQLWTRLRRQRTARIAYWTRRAR
jgi:hypothetical protein